MQRRDEIRRVFGEAIERDDRERDAYLRTACGADHALHRAVIRLVDAYASAPEFLDSASWTLEDHLDEALLSRNLEQAAGPDAIKKIGGADSAKAAEYLPSAFGRYRILRLIGSGGMADVYLAEQADPIRKVALKVIKRGMVSDEVIARFETERQVLAMMDHPGVAKVYDAGTAEDGRPYFALEYVEGLPITTHCDRQELGITRRLELLIEVCDAVQHAHQKGVIHRDIKPSNILVACGTDKAVPKVIDFGVAKALDHRLSRRTLLTEQGQLIGTPEYMSPEQVGLAGEGIDTRTDVYALGVVAYELLTGTLPYPVQHKSVPETARIIGEQPPTPLGSVDPRLRGDIQKIIAKSLEKEPASRYQSAAEFGADIRRHLNGEPPLIEPESTAEQFWRFVRRYRIPLAVTGTILLTLTAGIIVSMSMYVLAQRRLQQIVRLSDLHELRNLRIELKRVAASPENVPAFESWLNRARNLTQRLEQHRDTLRQLRQRAQPYTAQDRERDRARHALAADISDFQRSKVAKEKALAEMLADHRSIQPGPEAGRLQNEIEDVSAQIDALKREIAKDRSWTFSSAAHQWLHDVLAELVDDLQTFRLAAAGPGSIPYVERRLDFARRVRAETIVKHRPSWEQAIQSIADTRKSPQYGGLTISPQVGLVPVGRDPQSGLWEFAHLQTGAVPERAADGKLMMDEQSALVLVLLPGGTFNMGAVPPSPANPRGSPNVDPYAHVHDYPVHPVTLDPFFISKFEMTQGQWLRAENHNPSTWGGLWPEGEESFTLLHPVESISWHEADEALARLGLALPTDAQWEYAARAGTTTMWWTGDHEHSIIGAANIADRTYHRRRPIDETYNDWIDDGFHRHAPVGSFLPNAFGLHEVIGNAGEWCYDGCAPRSIPVRPGDGLRIGGEGGGGLRINRGGNFQSVALGCRSVVQNGYAPSYRSECIGVRPARRIDP